MIVVGKPQRVPGSVLSDNSIPSHTWQDEDGTDIPSERFRTMLRVAYHQADNDAAPRRAILRRPCPRSGFHPQGSWEMIWKPTLGNNQ